MPRWALALFLLLVPVAPSSQEVRTAVLPQAITVGDIIQVVIRVSATGAADVAFPDTLVLPSNLEPAGRRQIRRDTTAAGPRWTAVYPVTGWRPGAHALSPARVALGSGPAIRMVVAAFPEVRIRSVLPADTAGIQPRPARDVLGANRVWWPWLVLAVLLVLLVALLLYWRRRRARPPAPARPALPARELALRALDQARASGALEAGDFKRFYSDVSGALRAYVAAVDPALGPDLTTTELTATLRKRGRDSGTSQLRQILHAADLVKFARRRPDGPLALEEWQLARTWVESFEDEPTVTRAA